MRIRLLGGLVVEGMAERDLGSRKARDRRRPRRRRPAPLQEWLCAQAASEYAHYDPETGRFHLDAAQAGEARLAQVCRDAGFTRFRRATQTQFNIVLEARP